MIVFLMRNRETKKKTEKRVHDSYLNLLKLTRYYESDFDFFVRTP